LIVAVDVVAAAGTPPSTRRNHPDAPAEALIRLATQIEREWLPAGVVDIRHALDETTGAVRATRVTIYDDMILDEHPTPVDPAIAARLIEESYLRRGPSEAETELLRRLRVAGSPLAFDDLVRAASQAVSKLSDVDVARHVPDDVRQTLERHAPSTLAIPSGREVPLEYRDDNRVVASVKLQELFGLGETP